MGEMDKKRLVILRVSKVFLQLFPSANPQLQPTFQTGAFEPKGEDLERGREGRGGWTWWVRTWESHDTAEVREGCQPGLQ